MTQREARERSEALRDQAAVNMRDEERMLDTEHDAAIAEFEENAKMLTDCGMHKEAATARDAAKKLRAQRDAALAAGHEDAKVPVAERRKMRHYETPETCFITSPYDKLTPINIWNHAKSDRHETHDAALEAMDPTDGCEFCYSPIFLHTVKTSCDGCCMRIETVETAEYEVLAGTPMIVAVRKGS